MARDCTGDEKIGASMQKENGISFGSPQEGENENEEKHPYWKR